VAGTARLEEHGAARLLLEEDDQLVAAQLALEHGLAVLVHAVDLKDGFDSLFAIDKTGRAHPLVRRG
jgi:hypothetical protein